MYFLDFNVDAQGDFLDWLHAGHARGFLPIAALDPTDLPGLSKLVRKYADRPMELADASLVWLANKTDITDIITMDRADFSVYRTNRRTAFRNVFVVRRLPRAWGVIPNEFIRVAEIIFKLRTKISRAAHESDTWATQWLRKHCGRARCFSILRYLDAPHNREEYFILLFLSVAT